MSKETALAKLKAAAYELSAEVGWVAAAKLVQQVASQISNDGWHNR